MNKALLIFIILYLHSVCIAQKPILVIPNGHASQCYYLAFSRDDKYLISCSEDKTAKVWEVGSGKLLYTLSNHTDIVETGSFSPNGKYLLTSSRDQSAIV